MSRGAGRWRDLGRDSRGLALVEFAMVLPVLIVLYLGSVQLQDGIACNRKVTIATRATADLMAQNATGVTTAREIDSSLAAATQVMAPYRADRAVVRLTQVTVDNRLQLHVDWSRALNGQPDTPGTIVSIPMAMRVPGVTVLVAHLTYNYKPPSNFGFIKPISFNDYLVMLPRNTPSITCTDCQTQ